MRGLALGPCCAAALVVASLVACAGQGTLVGGPCEGCEAVFEYGQRTLTATTELPDWEREGPRLELRGTIYGPDGRSPAASVILYVYHTNRSGRYETLGDETGWDRRHGILRGWIRTDETGRYRIRTLLPGTYPDRSESAHIHGTVLEPDGRYYWIDEWRFRGDALLDEREHDAGSARGRSGLVTLEREGEVLIANRDIFLGLNVPGYQVPGVRVQLAPIRTLPVPEALVDSATFFQRRMVDEQLRLR